MNRRWDVRDHGAALVLTLFATTLVMIVGTTIMTVTISNLRMASLSQQSGASRDAAEAGVAQAAAYLRTQGVASIACTPTCDSGYGSRENRQLVTLPGGARARVWVKAIAPLPDYNPGRYMIISTGTATNCEPTGPSASVDCPARQIRAEVDIGTRPLGLPLALFARSFNGGGNGAVYRESILTTGCVWSRGHIQMSGTDVAYGIPAAVHSSQYVSDSNGGTSNCSTSNKAIHKTKTCNPSWPHDHDVQGGPFPAGSTACPSCASLPAGTDCSRAAPIACYYAPRDLDGDGSIDVNGSWIKDDASLRRLFSVPEKPFTDDQLNQLRLVAQSQDQYYTGPAFTSPDPETYPHSVMFFDLPAGSAGNRLVDLKDMGTAWNRQRDLLASSAACADRSLLIVVVNGDVRLNGNGGSRPPNAVVDAGVPDPSFGMTANIVLTSPSPLGKVSKAHGNGSLIGTIYADSIDLTGTGDVSLDECFVQNLSPSLVDTTLTITRYREVAPTTVD
jgi:hypothetical protein